MKTSSLALLALIPLAESAALGQDFVRFPPVQVGVSELFVPVGFDDNDEAVVVLDGYLPDSCYKVAFNKVSYDSDTKTYTVAQFARHIPGICLQVIVPFTTEARLGVIPAGSFKVVTRGADTQPLAVKEASSAGPDDYTYAPVDEARIEKAIDGTSFVAIIEGRFTNTCMKLDEVKVIDSGRTIEVLPVVESSGDACRDVEVPYSWRVDLPAGITEGRHLLHVRSLNGKAVNKVFTVGRPRLTL